MGTFANKLVRMALTPMLAIAIGAGAAQAQGNSNHQNQGNGNQDNHGNNGNNGNGNNGNHGNGNNGNHGNGNNGNHGNPHFNSQDANRFAPHYSSDINRWKSKPQGRPQFQRGQHYSSNYRFQSVPSSYYRGMPPPPSGYRYGYYDGYVVTYNPTTRIIGDILDLVSGSAY